MNTPIRALLASLVALAMAACATQSKSGQRQLNNSLKLQSLANESAKAQQPPPATGETTQPPAAIPGPSSVTIMIRSNELMRVQQDFDKELTAFSSKLANLTGHAQFMAVSQTSIKWAGLASGIGGAAAAAASPANVVWVAALSGFSGAANGFGAAAESEGFSKAIVASFLRPLVDEVAAAVNEFSLAEAQELLWKADGAIFWKTVKEQSKHLGVIKAANLKLLQPVITAPAPPQPKSAPGATNSLAPAQAPASPTRP